MYKIAVLGDYDSIYGYAALGLSIFPAGSRERGAELFGQLTAGEYGIDDVCLSVLCLVGPDGVQGKIPD